MANCDDAWAAGLFEGEGYVSVQRTARGRPKVRVAINMTDRDVLERFARIMGGHVLGPYDRGGRKPMFTWQRGGFDVLRDAFARFEPYLGERRTARFREVLALEPAPGDAPGHYGRDQTHCKRGHPLNGPNLYVRPDRGTRECRKCKARPRPERMLEG